MKATKYLLMTLTLLASTATNASMSYECWRYVSGKPEGYVKVSADNNADAVRQAEEKFRDMGSKVDYVKCK